MAYVSIPKDITKVKTKALFGLTKRQLICFGGGALVGVPLFFLLRGNVSASAAALCMIIVMLPFFMLALYEKNGQPMEKLVWNYVQSRFLRPKRRPYRTNNFYTVLARQARLDKEVKAIVQKNTRPTVRDKGKEASSNARPQAYRRGEKTDISRDTAGKTDR